MEEMGDDLAQVKQCSCLRSSQEEWSAIEALQVLEDKMTEGLGEDWRLWGTIWECGTGLCKS